MHSLPFPAINREFIFHSKITRDAKTGAIKIQMDAMPEFCQNNADLCVFNKESSLVRVSHSHGHYLLEAINKHLTRVTWTHHTNPEGHLPKWMINSLIQEMPFKTLQGLRKKHSIQKT
ncbi:START domain-containing protein [sulfur-oxidizing endosymbiont of Gigantopelta aegis]|uniref:START domain-containing protein n=1 Tax=sulfur-oxidizing endosymbiont of Gigantopelta aegis TaxID=2794934 RepID=UPI0018DE2977|nr:START domain-containing protein [sulfur-oxidizing endosymbiont of Gigantopelta aegis]